jgi:hypothetical protein
MRWEREQRIFRTRRRLDLDGDSVLDAAVPLRRGAKCAHDVLHALYVVVDGCGYLVGEVAGDLDKPGVDTAPVGRHGLRDLRTEAIARKPTEIITTARRYAFDGRSYHQQSKQQTASKGLHTDPHISCSGPK